MRKQVILVTGASKGIGKEIATTLAEDKNNFIALAARNDSYMMKAMEKYDKTKFIIHKADVRDEDSVKNVVLNTMNKFGQILDIIPLADEVVKKQALCAICRNGKRASFTKRLTKENVQKLIGSTNYIPVCRKCHKS